MFKIFASTEKINVSHFPKKNKKMKFHENEKYDGKKRYIPKTFFR